MKPALFSMIHGCKLLIACLLLLVSPLASSYDEETGGWSPPTFVAPDPWEEQQQGLPAYPEQDRLLELAVNMEGRPYSIYIDPASLTMGEDQVARYTVVIISSTGVWNVSYEGLHCGERAYRRYAYGFDGQWTPLADSSWQPLTDRGVNWYRKTLYNIYMCSPTEPFMKAEQVLGRLRSGNSSDYE